MSDEFVWLQHEGHNGTWRCPAAAVDLWTPLGWYRCDPPEEVNLATIEQPKPEPAPAAETKPVKTKTTGTEES